MSRERLNLLFLSQFPPSPPTFGAQRRLQGLMSALSRRHDVTAVSLLGDGFDRQAAEQAMGAYCKRVVLVPAAAASAGMGKRVAQLRSLFSRTSFERRFLDAPALQGTLDGLLRSEAFDVVELAFPFLAHLRLRQAPPGAPLPKLVLDEHNIEHDLARQMAKTDRGFLRRLHNSANWPKIQREEVEALRSFDGAAFCSGADEARARALVPGLRASVISNAVDIDAFRPRPGDPPPDGRTLVFFGTMNYYPNIDGILYFLREIWPLLEASHPLAKVKVIGSHPPPELLAFAGPRVEIAGLVDDVRAHLAPAAACIVPLRIGGGTRFKILEAMAMGKAVVSTTLGAEGLDARDGRELLIADGPERFAAAVGRVLDEPALGPQLGAAGRVLVEERYSWDAVVKPLEELFFELLDGRARP